MKLKHFLNESENKLKDKIQQFFKESPSPKDSEIHDFAENEGFDPDDFEEIVYNLLGSFLGEGRSKDFKGKYDPKELKMGIDVEMEHTTDPFISRKIAYDHLAEFKDYYTRLAKMEDEAKEYWKNE